MAENPTLATMFPGTIVKESRVIKIFTATQTRYLVHGHKYVYTVTAMLCQQTTNVVATLSRGVFKTQRNQHDRQQ